MKTTNQKLPAKASNYITKHFREDFLFEVKEIRQIKANTYFTVEVTKDDYIHTLTFNEEGELVRDDTNQAFPPDPHESRAVDDMSE